MADCNVCSAELGEAIYRSAEARSVTSMCEFYPGPTEVYFCGRCSHLQTTAIKNIETYYDSRYNILIDSEEEDTLYEIVEGKRVYRAEHQVQTLLRAIDLPEGARVLDFGCAKSATSRKLLEARSDLQVHLFDVSEAYIPFWERFVEPARWSTYVPKPEWAESFDVVLSFFALEHVMAPRRFVADLAHLLKPGGYLHLLVPNVYANTADFVVADHVNHFSDASLVTLLGSQGFGRVSVDDQAHEAAFVVSALKSPAAPPTAVSNRVLADLRDRVTEMSRLWTGLSTRIRQFEQEQVGRRAAIYGSGFYGTFIASCLTDLTRVECFFDRNPFRQTKTLLGKSILEPSRIDSEIDVVYVGLNPRIAHQAIEGLTEFRARPRQYFYM